MGHCVECNSKTDMYVHVCKECMPGFTSASRRLAVTEGRLAAIHELLGEINELFEKAKEILEGNDV